MNKEALGRDMKRGMLMIRKVECKNKFEVLAQEKEGNEVVIDANDGKRVEEVEGQESLFSGGRA